MSGNAVAHSFARHAYEYAQQAQVQVQIADSLLSMMAPANWYGCCVDLAAGVGMQLPQLQQNFPNAHLLAIDLAAAMCHQAQKRALFAAIVQADVLASLPLRPASIRYLFSSSVLQWSCDLRHTLSLWADSLLPGGEAAFSCVLRGSLCEIEQACLSSGRASPVNELPSFDQLESACQAAEWRVEQCFQQQHRLCFASADALLQSIRGAGASYSLSRTGGGLLTRRRWQQFLSVLPRCPISKMYFLTYEVAYVRCRRN